MKNVLILLVLSLSFASAQDNGAGPGAAGEKPADKKPAAKALVRRLEAVTWNPVRGELKWTVTEWDVETNAHEPAAKEQYTMHLDAAVMEAGGEVRRFDTTEARRVRILMDVISTYAVESTVWWDSGQDASLDGQVIPLPDEDQSAKGTKSEDKANREKEEKPKPAPKMLPGPKAALDPQPTGSDAAVALPRR